MSELQVERSADAVIVRTAAGALEGRHLRSVNAFLGIPFAAPPFGQHRMRTPQPVTPWNGVRSATSYGPTVPKGDYPAIYRPYFHEVVIPGDDCLNLNIWTPDVGDACLPVLVWIHGGSFANGSGANREYAGWSFARDGIVCVTINYRLGAEGFLYFDDGCANLGLHDQIAALQWVQANIAAFGGDPSKVTVAGQSAGALSVTSLLSSPHADGLFARAIAQSGFAVDTLSPDVAALVPAHIANAFGITNSRDAFREIPPNDLALISAALVEELEFHPDPDNWGELATIGSPFSPTIDGDLLPRNPLESFGLGQGRNVELLIGSMRDEVRISMVAGGSIAAITDAELNDRARALGLSREGVETYQHVHRSASAAEILAAIWTDWIYTLSAIRVAEARDGAAGSWVYRFDYPDAAANGQLSACHGAEMPFVFDCINLPEVRLRVGDAPSQDVADLAHRVWVDFVNTGEPGWEPYTPRDRRTALIAHGISVANDPVEAQRTAWEGVR